MDNITLHRAPWIVSISKPVIEDGAVASDGTQILESGRFSELKKRYSGSPIREHKNCVLLPPLINAHIHLELSHIHIDSNSRPISGFTDWITRLLTTREKSGTTGHNVEKDARAMLLQQHKLGVIALGDIGNTQIGAHLAGSFPGILLHFHEVLGRSVKSRRSILEKINHAPDEKLFTAHAPYSTHSEIIQSVKNRARKLGHPFSIHTAEPDSEYDMICKGSGELFDFLKLKGFIEDSYIPPAGEDNKGSVNYLNSLGVLDKKTICVHCIHISPEEVRILAETETKICLCPGSNRHLNVGRAPVKLFLDNGILPALGTDSRASNPELSIWREMRLLKLDNPDVDPEDILVMATLGGALTLGLEKKYGSLEQGRNCHFLSVLLPQGINGPDALFDFLVSGNEGIVPDWVL